MKTQISILLLIALASTTLSAKKHRDNFPSRQVGNDVNNVHYQDTYYQNFQTKEEKRKNSYSSKTGIQTVFLSDKEIEAKIHKIFSEENMNINTQRYFTSFTYYNLYSEENYVLGGQPTSEILGKNGTRLEAQIGFVGETLHGYDRARSFMYVWNNKEKNNEIGLGIGGEYIYRPFTFREIGLHLGGKAGIGYQKMNGERRTFSTRSNKINFITDSSDTPVSTPTEVEFNKDTYVVSIALITGISYSLATNIELDLNINYELSNYQVGYKNLNEYDVENDIRNDLSIRQDNFLLGFTVVYNF